MLSLSVQASVVLRSRINWQAQAQKSRHSVDMLAMSEDLPNPDSRVRLLKGDCVEIDYRPGGTAAHDRFVSHTRRMLKGAGFCFVLRHGFGITAPSHQCGTVRMGIDPSQSALDPLCRSHDHPNLYVVDAGSRNQARAPSKW